jgi:hypothetical protein|tara:strand:- start:372 stop:650 length:279 start_codon:yes stop_codon:yes gene_type:complete
MQFLIKDLKLEVIATFQDNEQDMFQITRIYADDLKSETTLLNSIKEQLKRSSDDLVKLSLCWICKNIKPYAKNQTIKATLEKNGKYFFGSWA